MSFRDNFLNGANNTMPPGATPEPEALGQKTVAASLAPLVSALSALPAENGRGVELKWRSYRFLGMVHVELTIHYDVARGLEKKPPPVVALVVSRDRRPHPSVTVLALCDTAGHIKSWTIQDNNTLERQKISDSTFLAGGQPRDGMASHPVTHRRLTDFDQVVTHLGVAIGRLFPTRIDELGRLMTPANTEPSVPYVPPMNPRLKL